MGFIDKSEIRCTQDGEKINMNIEVRNIILDLKRLGKTTGQISKTLSKSGAILDMLFRIHEVIETVNTAGLSFKKIRYCFGLKQNTKNSFNHTGSFITRILRLFFT